MGKAVLQISRSPFTRCIKQVELPHHFNKPTFTIYNGKMDPVEHVSHFNQRMTIHSKNKVLMCKMFPSSLGPVAMRWFDGLEEGSISSYEELTRTFGARFVTCSQVLRPLDSLLSMAIIEGETLKNYFDRYWEMYNEIDGDFEDVAIRTVKVGLPTQSDLWKLLTMKPSQRLDQLMNHIEEHKKVKDDESQSKGKAKIFTPNRKDNQSDQYKPSRPKREFFNQASHNPTNAQVMNSVFKELIYHVLEKIENETVSRWGETPIEEIKVFIASITKTEVTQRRTARHYRFFSTSWLELGSLNSLCINPLDEESNPRQGPKRMLFFDHPWE